MEEKKGYLKAVGIDKSFKMKTNHGSVVAEIYDLEGLKEAIEKAPAEAILFHMAARLRARRRRTAGKATGTMVT